MTHYFFVDESGDPGLEGEAGSSSHFVIAMVQLPERMPLYPLARVRKTLGLSPTFEFKYYKTATAPKDRIARGAGWSQPYGLASADQTEHQSDGFLGSGT